MVISFFSLNHLNTFTSLKKDAFTNNKIQERTILCWLCNNCAGKVECFILESNQTIIRFELITNRAYNFVKLSNEALGENDDIGSSLILIMAIMNANTRPLLNRKLRPNYCSHILHYHYFVSIVWANWDCIHELICNDVLPWFLVWHHWWCSRGVWLFTNSNVTYVKRDDLSLFIPHVIECVPKITKPTRKTHHSATLIPHII